ncbi:MAG TPA: asparagine synthase-related protein, partial [Gammaproteobacteria bacterium]|nr:asparagine synthase-related protein [Gammaproteobacteria bacterium]
MDSNAGVLVALAGRPRHDDGANGAFAARDIAERYRARGLETLDELKGHFALAVIDLTHGDALLAVDRFGVEPLYFSVRGEALLFSSRADSLAAHPLGDTGLDAQSIFDYVYFHCIPAPRSVYAHQQRLLPGQFARFRGGRIQIGFYWQLSYDSHSGSSDTLENEFRHSLEQAVARAADSGPVGAFLSGGTDSSTITGLLSRLQERVDTYSIGFDAGGYDEMQYARIASRHFGTVPHEYYVTPEDVVAAVPLIARAYDEPFGNASAV